MLTTLERKLAVMLVGRNVILRFFTISIMGFQEIYNVTSLFYGVKLVMLIQRRQLEQLSEEVG